MSTNDNLIIIANKLYLPVCYAFLYYGLIINKDNFKNLYYQVKLEYNKFGKKIFTIIHNPNVFSYININLYQLSTSFTKILNKQMT